jgi:hypothetical protein
MALSTTNVTSGFIDLATFDEIDKYMYGGADATVYFVRETRKSTWFTQIPVPLQVVLGEPKFGSDWSVSISRAGDYLLQTWLQLNLDSVSTSFLNSDTPNGWDPNSSSIRWTKNFMHNLIKSCSITFNDLVAAKFDNYFLDFWAAFTVPAGKRDGYNQMIGNTQDLTDPTPFAIGGVAQNIDARTLFLPLPFFYTRDSGVALPTAALPYNELRINFSFRNWNELLIVNAQGVPPVTDPPGFDTLLLPGYFNNIVPTISNVEVWANYAIVSNDERKQMACAPRDILIEQVQTAPRQPFIPGSPLVDTIVNYDIRFSHAIKVLFFGIRNTTHSNLWSNYTTTSPKVIVLGSQSSITDWTFDYDLQYTSDPISEVSLIYENSKRLPSMLTQYFSLINPYYNAPVIPLETGYHMYSYSTDFFSLDPHGSTNYGKLTNVSMSIFPSEDCKQTWSPNPNPDNQNNQNQTFEFVLTSLNNNIIRISGGAIGFPIL